MRRNREGFERYELRMRRLVDVGRIDTAVTLFGKTWPTPIVLAPASSQRAFHPEGELAVARAARAKPHLVMLSTVATTSVEQVTAALGAPVWYQLYTTDDVSVARALVKRAESAGSPALVLTVDLQGGSNRETQERFARRDARECVACHGDPEAFRDYARHKPMFDGLDLSRVKSLEMPEIWGLAAFGQRGVEAVLEILTRELSMVMGQAGTASVGGISRAHVADRARF